MSAPRPNHGADGTPEPGRALLVLDAATAERIFREAAERYFAERRAKVGAFVDRHFSLAGSARLHRKALGPDVLRVPANIALAVPTVAMRLAAVALKTAGARDAARRLEGQSLFLETDVGREVAWLVQTELLELPCALGERVSPRDALAEALVADPRIGAPLRTALDSIARGATDPAFRDRLAEALAIYAGSRTAASEIATSLISLGIGAAAFKQITPGVLSLGPAVAAGLAQHAAVAGFPLGAGLGGLWYGLFPAAATPLFVAGVTGGLMAAGATMAAFAGVVADPIQRRLGIHQRRLRRLIDVLERNLLEEEVTAFAVRDHYVARLLDLFDLLRTAYGVSRS